VGNDSPQRGSLGFLFDAIILHKRLPIFSYTSTFHEGQLLELGRKHRFLVPVVVEQEAYAASKESALAELQASRAVPPGLARSILDELDAFGYEWQPHFEEDHPLSPEERRLRSFLLGGLIFGGYAQQLTIRSGAVGEQAEHLLQPKRARLFLAASIGDASSAVDDNALLRRLRQISDRLPDEALHIVELPPMPSFLPLLLRHDPESPKALLQLALAWRESDSVRTFRDWYRWIATELHRGYRPVALEQELRQLRADIARELGRAARTGWRGGEWRA
jgi:hypothetical protein